MTRITTNNGQTTVAFGYDAANRQVSEEQTLAGSPTWRVETPRDGDGNRRSLNVAGWFAVLYDYTQRNQLDHIYGGGGVEWFNYTYDAAGNLTKRQDVFSGVNDSINVPPQWYDPLNRPVMWENTQAGDAVFARSWYQYDKVGREVATWRDEQGGEGEWFEYSTTNQLTKVRYNADHVSTGSPMNWDGWVDYGYTPDGLNRWYVNDNGNFAWVGVNALNQYTSVGGAALGYDERFNLRLHGGYQFDYDASNRLVSAAGNGQSAGFIYDGLGRCVKRTVNGVATVVAYDGWKPTVEWSELGSRDIDGQAHRPSERARTSQLAGGGSYYAYNVYGAGPDEILWRYDSRPGYGHLRYHHDRHGNVTSLLNDYGSIIEKYSYDAFGAVKVTDPAGNERRLGGRYASWYGNRFLFQGREFIHELGIYDYRHRMYQPAIGRFLQTDPIGLHTEGEKLTAGQKALFSPGFTAPEAFTSSEMNLYRYCGDDPINHADPFGLYWDLREYDHANNWKVWQMILAVQRLPVGDPVGDRFRAIDNSPSQVIILPIQTDPAARIRYGLAERAVGDTRNMTSSNDPVNDKNGFGTNSRIEFDPNNKKDPDGNPRDPIDALIHEAAGHAYGNLTGTKLPGGGDPNQPEEKRARDIQKQGHKSLEKAGYPYKKNK